MKQKVYFLPRQPQPSFGLGAIAGGSVPATATAAGYFYIISSAGTSQSITWAVGDWAVYNGVSGSWTKVPFASTVDLTAYANFVGARATRGGMAFDGTTNCRASAVLTGQDIGTGDFSLVWQGQISTVAADQWLVAVGPSLSEMLGGAGGVGIFMTTAGHLQAGIQATGGYEFRRISNFRTTYGGKEVLIVVTRTGSTLKIYINGVDTAHTAGDTSTPMLAASITSTYIAVNFRGTNYSTGYTGLTRDWGIANCVLTQAQVTEIQETGAVPEALKWGCLTRQWAGYSYGYGSADGTTVGGTTVRCAATNQTATPNSGGSVNYLRIAGTGSATDMEYWTAANALPNVFAAGTKFRVKGYARAGGSITGFGLIVGSGSSSKSVASASVTGLTSSWTAFSVEVTTSSASIVNQVRFALVPTGVGAVSDYLEIDDLEMQPFGFIGRWVGDRGGVGLQWPEDSTNKLPALVTTTGATWTKPATMGYVRALSDGTTTAQQLGGGTILPANVQIVRIRARSLSGTPSITLGTSSGGSQIVASVALSTTWQNLTIALAGGINSSAASLWMTASAANVVEVQLAYEQLPA